MIVAESISKSYGDVTALKSISFSLADGETLGITGPSGSGKTTLLRLIAGLEIPTSGRIVIDGQVASTPRDHVPPHERSIGFVFQESALWPHMTVNQNIMFGLHGVARARKQSRIGELLLAMDIESLARRRPAELSAGQARRVALARALAPRPRHLLMDEPLTNLDEELKSGMLELVKDQVRQSAANLIYVSHDASEVSQIASRVIEISGGAAPG